MDYVLLNLILADVDVKMDNCRCNPIQKPFEFPIIDNNNSNIYIEDYYPEINNLCDLKKKIICDFYDIINKLECGIQPDLEFLLQEISLIYIYNG